MKRPTGHYVTVSVAGGEPCRAFVPNPLPPDPALHIDAKLQEAIDKATMAIGRLDGLSTLLPDKSLFLYMYVRKEAVLSAQIEGTQTSFTDFLKFENQHAPGVPLEDVVEVSNYVAAMTHALQRLQEGLPLSLRLIKEIHSAAEPQPNLTMGKMASLLG
jgi:Fic family protein